MGAAHGTEEERFWPKVKKTDTCWIWTANRNNKGYGTFTGSDGRDRKSHRVAWTFMRGPIPEGLHVLHHCDVRECVNPDHLFLGTNQDNVTDKVTKGRSPQPMYGTRNPQAVLNEDAVRRIREAFASGTRKSDIARQMGLSESCVGRVLNGQTWRHVS